VNDSSISIKANIKKKDYGPADLSRQAVYTYYY